MHAPASPVVTTDFQLQAHCGRLSCSVQAAVGSGSGSREHPNTGAVACHFEQGETKRVLLSTEDAADQPFRVLRHPIAPRVLHDFKMVRGQYSLRRKVAHAGLLILLLQLLL